MIRVRKFLLRNFRNLRDCEIIPHPKISFFTGSNGQGKTAILEGLSYLATLRSFRNAKSEEIVTWGENQGEVIGNLSPDGALPGEYETELKVKFSRFDSGRKSPTWRKAAFINGKSFRSSAQYLSQRFGAYELGFHTVIFNPSDHDLVRGEPAGRRAYLDRVITAEDVGYLELLHRYQRLLTQRNALLKGDFPTRKELLRDFTGPMAKLAAQIALSRLEWLQRLQPGLLSRLQQIAPDQKELALVFSSNWAPRIEGLLKENNELERGHFAGQERQASLELLEQAYWRKVSALEQAELKAGSSLVGPHRDDWAFLIGGRPLKGHGSQGEIRSSLLAMKLTEIELFSQKTGHQPLFLLDDFSSELDKERRVFLLDYIQSTDLQVFVTTTEASVFEGIREGAHFLVERGEVSLRKSA